MNTSVNIRITNASGHTDLVQDLGTAIQTVIDAHFGNKQWPYVGTRVFQFTATSADDPAILADAARLREMIEESPEGITVTLAGDLAGGTPAEKQVTLRITNASGHSETTEGLGAAIAAVIEAHLKNKQWAYVNSNVFQFDEEALNNPATLVEETQRLRDYVEDVDGPVTITLTGDLAGGQ